MYINIYYYVLGIWAQHTPPDSDELQLHELHTKLILKYKHNDVIIKWVWLQFYYAIMLGSSSIRCCHRIPCQSCAANRLSSPCVWIGRLLIWWVLHVRIGDICIDCYWGLWLVELVRSEMKDHWCVVFFGVWAGDQPRLDVCEVYGSAAWLWCYIWKQIVHRAEMCEIIGIRRFGLDAIVLCSACCSSFHIAVYIFFMCNEPNSWYMYQRSPLCPVELNANAACRRKVFSSYLC